MQNRLNDEYAHVLICSVSRFHCVFETFGSGKVARVLLEQALYFRVFVLEVIFTDIMRLDRIFQRCALITCCFTSDAFMFMQLCIKLNNEGFSFNGIFVIKQIASRAVLELALLL